MVRHLRILITLLATFLLATTILLWIRSPHHAQILAIETPHHHITGVAAGRDGMLLAYSDIAYEGYVTATSDGGRAVALLSVTPEEYQPLHDTLIDNQTTKLSLAGVKLLNGQLSLTSSMTPKFSAMLLPYWLVTTALAIVPLFAARRLFIRQRRIWKGLCLSCGYDIRASVGQCPECGRPITRSSQKSEPSSSAAYAGQ